MLPWHVQLLPFPRFAAAFCIPAEILHACSSQSHLLAEPIPSDHGCAVPAAQQGVRRALVECVLRLSCGDGVLQEFQMYLAPLDPTEQDAYEAVTELYGTPRMLLAVLSRQLLDRVRLLPLGWSV